MENNEKIENLDKKEPKVVVRKQKRPKKTKKPGATKLRRGDMVKIIAGKDLNHEGKILSVDREKNRVVVEGFNIVTKHRKPNRTNQTGGIIKIEAPIHASNVMYLHKGQPTRLGYKVEETTVEVDGKTKRKVVKQRYAKSTGEIIDDSGKSKGEVRGTVKR